MLVGAGHMGRSALGMLARQIPDARFKIVDRSPESLKLAVAADPVRIEGELRDISRAGLDAAGVDLVLNFAGPFFVGSDAAARAAIAAGAAYIDVCDDAEGTRTILDLHQAACERGVPVITGGGNSPGISNWLACDILQSNKNVDGIQVVWITRERDPGGLAVLRHMLHMTVAPCPIWREGRMEYTKGFQPQTAMSFDVPAPFGRIEAYDTAHPEPLTLARYRPDLRLIQCKGSLYPAWANQAFSTLGRIGFAHDDLTVEIGGQTVQPIEVLWKLLWSRHNANPSRERPAFTQINVIGLEGDRPVVMHTITDDSEMSRGTGIGMAAAALALLEGNVPAGANGVEAIPFGRGLNHFKALSVAEGAFADGIVVTRF
ncbi:MAG: saccharopine dehydrogenase NADP-binding domain-containing protein [Mesorhizobium sp.]|nr:saccharopine dehydrogenase NADP-binding domain-containing protein [Mesorhizobium sp.]